jgi:amidophosphoribosyltransferase
VTDIRHNCGFCVAHTLPDAYNFLGSLQHRGREATGIAAIGNKSIDVVKWAGTVNRVDIEDLHKIFPSPPYHTYLGHVRYATRGRKDKILEDAHPHVIGGELDDRKSHILITNCDMAIVHNGQVDSKYLGEMIGLRTGCDTEAVLQFYRKNGEAEILRKIPGVYSMAIADKRKDDVIVLRDRTGMKPAVMGLKDGKYVVVSEDIALRKNGCEPIESIEPGCAYYLKSNGSYVKRNFVAPKKATCFFEFNYIANVDTIMDGVSVRVLREFLGEELAREFKRTDVDIVTYLPRCPEPAARSFAKNINRPFIPLFYKLRGERAFQGSTPDERKSSIDQNLHLLPGMEKLLSGKVVAVVDDSTVRGNNAKREMELLINEAKVKKCYHINYTPPIGIIGSDRIARGCMFGVDMPPDDDFIARNRTIDEISQKMGMSVFYLSVEGMLRAFERVGLRKEELCTFCIGGNHPLEP